MRFYKKPVFRGVDAEDVHNPRAQIIIPDDPAYQFTKNSILTIIVLTTITVVGFMLFNLVVTSEFLVKHNIEKITNDYYQNYFYPSIPDPNALDFYKDRGFANVSLKQLLLYSDRKNESYSDFFTEYCDLDKTYIKIYPEIPYGNANYHVDYTYSCKF